MASLIELYLQFIQTLPTAVAQSVEGLVSTIIIKNKIKINLKFRYF